MTKIAHMSAGWICLALAAIGAVLPLLPTTPLVILAAFFFAKGSPRIHNWLINHRTFGPAIRDWEDTGAIAPKYKGFAVAMMAGAFLISVGIGLPAHLLLIQALCMGAAGTYVITRPNA